MFGEFYTILSNDLLFDAAQAFGDEQVVCDDVKPSNDSSDAKSCNSIIVYR